MKTNSVRCPQKCCANIGGIKCWVEYLYIPAKDSYFPGDEGFKDNIGIYKVYAQNDGKDILDELSCQEFLELKKELLNLSRQQRHVTVSIN